MGDAERFQDRGAAPLALLAVQPGKTVLDIALDRQVRKQSQVLKYIADSSNLRRNIDAERVVEQDFLRGRDSAGIRPRETRYAIEQCGLPRPRRTEQDRDPGRKGDREIEFEVFACPLADPHQYFASVRR